MFSRIFTGQVIHHRLQPNKHRFNYKLFMMYLDLDELSNVFNPFRFWSTENFNIASFRRVDHVGDNKLSLKESVKTLVKEKTGKLPTGPITLLTHLRYFGYVMNPVSFYFCWDAKRDYVETIVAEVHNTPWGEQHCYVLDGEIHSGKNRSFAFDKAFHVSPFMGMKQHYRWSFNCPGENLNIGMQTFEDDKHQFTACMRLHEHQINQRNLNRVLINYPLMTVKVIVAIYWQALQLWWKKTPFYEHPKHYLKQGANYENG
ncbi:MAG: DUF1365 domain-containing protein [Pseudomonadota bacterium]